jgi:uncharacterized membrane protein
MAKFAKSIVTENDDVAPAPAPTPAPIVVAVAAGGGSGGGCSSSSGNTNFQAAQAAAAAQATASVGLAQTAIDKEVVDEQIKKEDEHWVKAYWRPAMGWLYMLICFMDFVGFPLISMFLPVLFKGFGVQYQYVAWQSLSLSNGGLIHLAFGAILGVSAWTRGQEKLAKVGQ